MVGDINIISFEQKLDLGFLSRIYRIFRKRYTKENVNILFVDDTDMPVVDNLRKVGYRVKKVKDVKNIDNDSEVKNAQIIFVDFDGVGRTISPHHQGAGLIKELKDFYGSSKYIVLYTAQAVLPAGTIMDSLFSSADDRMRKDSDVTDFIEQIKKGLKYL